MVSSIEIKRKLIFQYALFTPLIIIYKLPTLILIGSLIQNGDLPYNHMMVHITS